MTLSHIASEHAAEIKQHDWSDAHSRLDRAGHQHDTDSNAKNAPQLSPEETARVRTNVMWVTAQVLGYEDPKFDVVEFAQACGVDLNEGWVKEGVRTAGGRYQKPGALE